ncbi:hypothetical protein Tco_0849587 [Tanacetum coccineum]
MRTRSSSNLVGNSFSNPTTSNPKCRNRRRSNQRVEPFALEESPVVMMADQRTMAELLRTPTEGYAEAIVVPPILAEHFKLKHSLINMMTSDQFFRLEKDNPHDHIRCLCSRTVADTCASSRLLVPNGLVLDGPTVPMPPSFVNPKDRRVEETLTDPEHAEYTIKVPPLLVQKAKPPSQRNYVVHQRDPRHPHIPYPLRMNQEK